MWQHLGKSLLPLPTETPNPLLCLSVYTIWWVAFWVRWVVCIACGGPDFTRLGAHPLSTTTHRTRIYATGSSFPSSLPLNQLLSQRCNKSDGHVAPITSGSEHGPSLHLTPCGWWLGIWWCAKPCVSQPMSQKGKSGRLRVLWERGEQCCHQIALNLSLLAVQL